MVAFSMGFALGLPVSVEAFDDEAALEIRPYIEFKSKEDRER